MRVRAVGVVALFALVVASCGGGVPETAGPSEGIQVHGDWVIDVYNEDGSLDRHVEFSNALTSLGDDFMADVLAGAVTQGIWVIVTRGNPSPCLINGNETPCTVEPPELQVSSTTGVLTLEGSFTADQAGVITSVETKSFTCTSNISPDNCTLGSKSRTVTSKSIATESVEANQTVQIRVDISFTSG